jgi:Rrf2 family protein
MWPAFAGREIVNLSARTQYACIAMLELALQYDSGQLVQIRKIADSHAIPARFLVQILLQLKSAGLVTSARGASGGYRLSRHPSQTSLWDVTKLVEGGSSSISENGPSSPLARVLREKWQTVTDAQRQMLQETSLADLAEQVQVSTAPMYYI